MVAATVEVDLVAPVDRVLGTGLDAGVAARAHVEIDRVLLRPLLPRTRPASRAAYRAGRCRLGSRAAAGSSLPARPPVMSTVTASWPCSRCAHASASPAGPAIRSCPSDLNAMRGTGSGSGSAAAAISAAIFRRGGTRFDRPARRFAHVDEADGLRLPALLRDVTEQARLLRAGDDDIAGRAVDKRREFFLAQLAMQRQRPGEFQRARERRGVERHGAVAVAQMQRTVAQAHWASTLAAASAAPLRCPKGAQFASWGGPAPLIVLAALAFSGLGASARRWHRFGRCGLDGRARFRRGREPGRQRRAEHRRHDLPRSPWSSAD